MTKQHFSLLLEFILWFGAGLIAFILTFSFDDKIALYRYGANLWPAIIAALLMICITAHCVYNYLFQHAVQEESDAEEHEPLAKIWPIFAVPAIYVLALPYAGFYVSTLVFLPAYTYIIQREKFLHTLSICLPVVSFLLIIFTKFLFVPFPVGTLPLFYELNSEIVKLLY